MAKVATDPAREIAHGELAGAAPIGSTVLLPYDVPAGRISERLFGRGGGREAFPPTDPGRGLAVRATEELCFGFLTAGTYAGHDVECHFNEPSA